MQMTTICAFIIPLRSKRVSSDWQLISYLCRQTVNSCLNTQVKEIRDLIIGHERPERLDEVRDNRVEFIEATHQPPES